MTRRFDYNIIAINNRLSAIIEIFITIFDVAVKQKSEILSIQQSANYYTQYAFFSDFSTRTNLSFAVSIFSLKYFIAIDQNKNNYKITISNNLNYSIQFKITNERRYIFINFDDIEKIVSFVKRSRISSQSIFVINFVYTYISAWRYHLTSKRAQRARISL